MKKLIILAVSIFSVSVAFAFEPVWRASHTATADTTKTICQSNTYLTGTSTITVGGLGIVHGVCVNDATAGSGTFTIYDASSTATNPFAVIRATSAVSMGCLFYDVLVSSGITYSNSATNDVTILYQCK